MTYASIRDREAQRKHFRKLEKESLEAGRGYFRFPEIDASLWTRALAYTAVIAAVVTPLCMLLYQIETKNHRRLYRDARAIAVMTIGDKRGKLTEEEHQMWYEKMGVKNDKPSDEQLLKFLMTSSLED